MASTRNYSSHPTPSAPPLTPAGPQPPHTESEEERDEELARLQRLRVEEEAAVVAMQYDSFNVNPHQEEYQIPCPSQQSFIDTNLDDDFQDNVSIPINPITPTPVGVQDTIDFPPQYTATATDVYHDHFQNHTDIPIYRSTPVQDTIIYPNMTSISLSLGVDTDEDFARKIEQDLRDEVVAIELQREEQEGMDNEKLGQGKSERRYSDTHVIPVSGAHLRGRYPGSLEHESERRRYRWNRKRILIISILAIFVGVAIFCIALFGSSIWFKLRGGYVNDDDDLPPPFHQDPWEDTGSNSTGDFDQWRNSGKGLKLEIRNALTDDWHRFFNQAVNDWNESPSLSLTIKETAVDTNCTHVQGILKVCNGFYGRKGWTGLNVALFSDKYIAASVSKMNESYLKGKSDAEKQYVMCHEIGHGFGLPHRDENRHNTDLGSCLDYTYRYENNMKPDSDVDFDNLFMLYGSINSDSETETETPSEEEEEIEIKDKKKNKNSNGRKLQRPLQGVLHNDNKAGRLLHQSETHEVYEYDLGHGNRVLTTVLLARED